MRVNEVTQEKKFQATLSGLENSSCGEKDFPMSDTPSLFKGSGGGCVPFLHVY